MSSNDIFCKAPFSQLLLNPEGRFFPCCYHFGAKLGDMKNDELSAVWNGKKIQKLRKEFLEVKPKTCRGRMQQIQCHQNFERLQLPEKPAVIMSKQPMRLDLRLNGLCNLRCVMCDVWQQPNHRWDDSNFWEDGPITLFPQLQEIDLLGGEPFVQKDTYRLIETVSAINKDCLWSFVTNGHYRFTKTLTKALDKIKIRKIQLSLDSLIPANYQLIRKGNLNLTLNTLNKWLDYRNSRTEPFDFVCSLAVIDKNFSEIANFLDFCLEKKIAPELQYVVYDPSGNSSLKYDSACEKEAKVAIIDRWLPNYFDESRKQLELIKRALAH